MDHNSGGVAAAPGDDSAARQTPRPKVMSVREFYDAIQGVIGLNTLYEFARSGRLRSVRIGRRLLILTSEVEDFFDREAEVN